MYWGVFDHFPELKICLGRCGEGPPGSCPEPTRLSGWTHKRLRHQRQNPFFIICRITPSAIPAACLQPSAPMNLLSETKIQNVTFSVDYPYESVVETRAWFETVPVSDETWRTTGYRNAIRIFNLPFGAG
ncbi:hypothetical protein AYL99_09279 [Fonsecaea erecta]|uniref:Uncharacterized protein n=1 Tax=Fonsecaea erecta TaxID=1367422 RepID=A0A178Z8I4_9EURO|nr:hypothetical protein AYL99_09279 [Fonsecaea erecta]OAP56100.1 hypothetical protein AYL99_09279 [Fonsecaea erecta]